MGNRCANTQRADEWEEKVEWHDTVRYEGDITYEHFHRKIEGDMKNFDSNETEEGIETEIYGKKGQKNKYRRLWLFKEKCSH